MRLTAIWAAVLYIGLYLSCWAFSAEAGKIGDPVVSRSYLEKVAGERLLPLQREVKELEREIALLEGKLKAKGY